MDYGDTLSIDPAVPTAPRVSRLTTLLRRLDNASDRLSPMVVKEVRQIVRGREFNYSFMVSLIIGLLVAFFGAANASGTGTTGQSVFMALMACLALLGVAVVPFGAFSALRNERLEQTMDLITVTSLSTRKVIVGKLLAQGVKLATLFAGMAPFIATSFLLGGIDFVTIVVSLAIVFLASLWVSAAALLASAASKARGVSAGLLAGGALLFVLFVGGGTIVPRIIFALVGAGGGGFGGGVVFGAPTGTQGWWALGGFATFAIASLVNLVLLAENRLSSPVENKATAPRIGFLMQFLAIVVVFVAVAWYGPPARRPTEPIALLGLLHLSIVAPFTVTEGFSVSRRVQRQMQTTRWRFTRLILAPGGGRGAAYVLLQMAVLLFVVARLRTPSMDFNWLPFKWVAAACGYICFFTGVPAVLMRWLHPRISAFRVRVSILVFLSASLVLPDVLYYLFARPNAFNLIFGSRHLINPLRTVANWRVVEMQGLYVIPQIIGTIGLLAYAALIVMNIRHSKRAEQGA